MQALKIDPHRPLSARPVSETSRASLGPSEPGTQGARQHFEQLFQRSRRRIYTFAYRLTGNAADAEDVTQDAYLRAWKHFDSYNPACSFEGWLCRILTNRAIDLRRRKRRMPTVSLEALTTGDERHSLLNERVTPHRSAQDTVLNRLMDESLVTALADLPDIQRASLMLCAVEERSYQEIADITGCAIGTVRSRIHRAREKLRRDLA